MSRIIGVIGPKYGHFWLSLYYYDFTTVPTFILWYYSLASEKSTKTWFLRTPPPFGGGVRVGVDIVPKLEKVDFGQKKFFSNFSFFEFPDPKNGQKIQNSKIQEFSTLGFSFLSEKTW